MNNKIIINFTVFFVFISSFGVASAIKINGIAESHKGLDAELVIYEDYFSFREKILAVSTIDSKGNFSLQTTLSDFTKAFIRIDNIATSIFLEPGNTYEINIPATDPRKEIQGNINFINHQMLSSSPGTLNSEIQLFNTKYDQFVEENYSLLITKSAKSKIEEFKFNIEKEYANHPNHFLKQYVFYSTGSLSQIGFLSQKNLYKNYIKDKPVLYNNPEYFSFIKEFYSNHLMLLSQSWKGTPLVDLINEKNYETLLELFNTDSTLSNPPLRELILIKGLRDAHNMPSVKKTSVIYLLKQISTKTQFPKNKLITDNVIWSLTRFEQGRKAPDFKLIDLNGDSISLSKFAGKYVYLSFWANWCNSCVNDMKVMKALYEKYQQNIVFLSVSIDKNNADYQKFLVKNPYKWNFAHYSSNKNIINDYDARSLPAYFLISPDGRFLEAHTSSPSENVEMKFQSIIKSNEKKLRVGEN
jgi:peroxiredoxin